MTARIAAAAASAAQDANKAAPSRDEAATSTAKPSARKLAGIGDFTGGKEGPPGASAGRV